MTARRLVCTAFATHFLLIAPFAGAQSPSGDHRALTARLDSLTRSWLASAPATGVTVGVIRGRDTLLLEGVGERDRDKHLPATATTVYRIGSITKQFTAAAIMQLVEQGKIRLTDPITRYLPEYPQWHAVTVRQLLNHTSGIHPHTDDATFAHISRVEHTPAELVALISRDTFDFTPGTQWRYDNTGYLLLGMILDRLTGESYPRYMQTHFFTPLGMRSATYCPSNITDVDHAHGYGIDGTTINPAQYFSMTYYYSAGDLCMSVPDYLRWQTALTGGRIVSAESYRLMSSSDTLANGQPTNYGFGLAPRYAGSHRAMWHDGKVPGFNTEEFWVPDASLRVVVFTNTAGSEPVLLLNNLVFAALGLPTLARTSPVRRALPADEQTRYTGIYDLRQENEVFTLHVFQQFGTLMLQAEGPGQGKFPLFYYGNDTFGASVDSTLRLTIFFDGGRAVRARLVQNGNVSEGARRP
jgi:D-alanyl-D-alanine carboxypeptidase